MSGPAETLSPAALKQRASDLHRAGRSGEARPLYAAYLSRVPQDGGMWSNLGALLRSEGRHDLALQAHARALALAPDSTVVMGNYANVLADVGDYARALPLRHRILAQDPGDRSQKALIGKALRAQGKYDQAIAWLETAIAAHPEDAELRIQLAMSQLADRRYAAGFRSYDIRWQTGELTPRKMDRPKWDGGSLAGKRILVLPEQGFGDAVTFARFLPVLRRFDPAQVLVIAEKPLLRLFQAVDGADWVGSTLPDTHDVWTNIMDLCPSHFDADPAVPPPTRLSVPADSIARARAMTAPHAGKYKVGVVWCGSVTYRGNAFRSFSHTQYLPLLDLPDLQLFSLYKGPELAAFHADGTSAFVIDTASSDRDFADCAAMMQQMDLIVTSDTATAHIAGSLGVPVWTLLHWDAFWLWQHSGTMTPWYPSMQLIRQSNPRDWDGVFVKVRRKLEAEIAGWRKKGAK